MAVLFLIFLDQICPKWIKLDQIGFLTNLKKDKNDYYFLFIFLDQICPKWIKLDQTWSNLIKLDQTWSNWIGCTYPKMLVYKIVAFTMRIKMVILFFIFLDQICRIWIKLDQTWLNWISHQSKNVTIKSCLLYRKDNNDCFVFYFFGSDLFKMDQTWSNLVKLDFSSIKKCYCKKLSHLQEG
jgi:hypothetical protein